MQTTNPRPTIKRVDGKIDLTEWGITVASEFGHFAEERFLTAIGEAMDGAMEDNGTEIGFGLLLEHDAPATMDPLTVHLRLALGSNRDHEPVYAFNLRESTENYIELCSDDGSYAAQLTRIRDVMRELADKIDAALPK